MQQTMNNDAVRESGRVKRVLFDRDPSHGCDTCTRIGVT